MTNYEQVESEVTVEPQLINAQRETAWIQEDSFEQKTAGFWMRFWAFVLDSCMILALVGLVIRPVFYVTGWEMDTVTWYAPYAIVSALFYYAYFVVMTYYVGQTFGKMIFGLRVVSLDGSKPSFSDVLFREWIGRFICNAFSLLYLLVIILDKNQGLHDYFANTKVVQEGVFVKKLEQVQMVQ